MAFRDHQTGVEKAMAEAALTPITEEVKVEEKPEEIKQEEESKWD